MRINVEKKNYIKLSYFNTLDYGYVGNFHEGLAWFKKMKNVDL